MINGVPLLISCRASTSSGKVVAQCLLYAKLFGLSSGNPAIDLRISEPMFIINALSVESNPPSTCSLSAKKL